MSTSSTEEQFAEHVDAEKPKNSKASKNITFSVDPSKLLTLLSAEHAPNCNRMHKVGVATRLWVWLLIFIGEHP